MRSPEALRPLTLCYCDCKILTRPLVPCVALDLTWLGSIHSISLAVRCRTAPCSNTLNQDLQKIQAAREYDFAPVLALSSIWEKKFLAPSMARSTAEAFTVACCLDRNGKFDDSPKDKKQKVASQAYSATNFIGRILLDRSPDNLPRFLGQSAVFALHRFFLT